MAVRAYLFDADGSDQEVKLDAKIVSSLNERRILWVDIAGSDQQEIEQVGSLLHLHRQSLRNLLNPIGRPRFDNYGEYFQINVAAVKQVDRHYKPLALDLFSGADYVVTVHPEPIEFLDNFNKHVEGDTQIGQLSAASFLAAILDWHITSYFQVLEGLEEEVDELDEVALLKSADRDLLEDLVEVRRRVSELRHLLAPHRDVFFALSRPDFEILASTESAAHFRALNARLERAIDAIEHAREMVIGTFELFMTGTAQNTNDTMKVLTLATVVIGMTAVIAGVMGMNFSMAFFETGATGFIIVVGVMIMLSLGLFLFAHHRRWL